MSACRHGIRTMMQNENQGHRPRGATADKEKAQQVSPSVEGGVSEVNAERSRGAHPAEGTECSQLVTWVQEHSYFLFHHSRRLA